MANGINIDCPKCQGENCFMGEDTEGVSIHCSDCGYSDYQPYEYDVEGFCFICNERKPTRMVRKDDFCQIDICRDCLEEI